MLGITSRKEDTLKHLLGRMPSLFVVYGRKLLQYIPKTTGNKECVFGTLMDF